MRVSNSVFFLRVHSLLTQRGLSRSGSRRVWVKIKKKDASSSGSVSGLLTSWSDERDPLGTRRVGRDDRHAGKNTDVHFDDFRYASEET